MVPRRAHPEVKDEPEKAENVPNARLLLGTSTGSIPHEPVVIWGAIVRFSERSDWQNGLVRLILEPNLYGLESWSFGKRRSGA